MNEQDVESNQHHHHHHRRLKLPLVSNAMLKRSSGGSAIESLRVDDYNDVVLLLWYCTTYYSANPLAASGPVSDAHINRKHEAQT